jgi:hypothetical protein
MAKILGFIWIILGILWLAKPQALKNRIERKMNRKMRWTIYGFLIIFGILMVGSVIKAPGLLPKIIGIIGLILIIKGISLLLSKASEKLWKWWAEQPLAIFRLQAFCILAIGIMLILI